MKSSAIIRCAAVFAMSGFIAACSSNPKEPEPEPALGAAISQLTPIGIINTARGPSLTLDDVLFDFEQSTLRSQADGTIDKAVAYLEANPQRNALIEGHTDHTGDANYNQSLSVERSLSIKDALVANGISSRRIKTLGMGESQPVADNQTLSGRQANRRVEIIFNTNGTNQ